MVHYYYRSAQRKDWIAVFKFKVKAKGSTFQSKIFLVNRWAFCNQLWIYNYASSEVVVSGSRFICGHKGQGNSKGSYTNNDVCFWYNFIFSTADSIASKPNSAVYYHKPKWPVKDWIAMLKVRVTVKVQIPLIICPIHIIWTAETSETRFCMVMHNHQQECYLKRQICYLQNKSRSGGS